MNKWNTRVASLKSVVALMFMGLLTAAAFAESPADIVKSAADELGQRLDGRKEELRKDRKALYALIDELLLPRFDRDYAARLVLGRHWRNASDTQRQRFIDAFYRALLQRYADGVLDYDSNRVEILPYRGDDEEERTTVRTIVLLDDGTKVPVNYALVQRESGWLMFDVTIEGISYIRNFRAEMHSEIQAKGLEAVIKRLESEADVERDFMSDFEIEDLGDGRFSLSGSMGFSTADQILKDCEDLFEEHTRIEVDLAGVTDTDSAGLALLLEWITWANHTVREIRFLNTPERITAIARTTEVEGLLKRGERWSGFIEAPGVEAEV